MDSRQPVNVKKDENHPIQSIFWIDCLNHCFFLPCVFCFLLARPEPMWIHHDFPKKMWSGHVTNHTRNLQTLRVKFWVGKFGLAETWQHGIQSECKTIEPQERKIKQKNQCDQASAFFVQVSNIAIGRPVRGFLFADLFLNIFIHLLFYSFWFYLFISFLIFLFKYLFIFWFIYVCIYLYIYFLFIYLFVYLFIDSFIKFFVYIFIGLSQLKKTTVLNRVLIFEGFGVFLLLTIRVITITTSLTTL